MRHTLLSLALLAGCQPDETDVSLTVLDADSDADADADADTDADADADSDADTDTDPVCDPITAFSIAPGGLLLDVSLHVEVGAAEDVFVACTSPTEPLEKHLVESSGPATSHDLPLRGLLPGTQYDCVARSTCGGDTLTDTVTTGLPVGIPVLTATPTAGETMTGAYTLFNEQGGCSSTAEMYVAIVDPDARLRWLYDLGADLILDMDVQMIDHEVMHIGGGWGLFDEGQSNLGLFLDVDLSGNVLLERTAPDFGLGFNHHSEALPDGTYLSITGDHDTNGQRTWNGIGVELWAPGQGVVWSWDSQALAAAGLVDPPTILDELLLPSPYHANASSILVDPLGDALWLSIYGYEELWRIDRSTGERTHVFGQGGDFTLVDTSGNPLPDREYTWVQHGIDYTADGRVLAYDNGVGRPGGGYSRVVEYRLDLTNNVATKLWDWTEPGWYNTVVGDADYLDGGNVLVTQGFSRCAEILPNDVSEIIELRPPDTVVHRITWPSSNWGVYRSQRYDGCDLFANARFCDTISQRWEELGVDSL